MGKIKLNNDNYVIEKISVCHKKWRENKCSTTVSKAVDIRIDWMCSSYFYYENKCKLTQLYYVATAREYNAATTVSYEIIPQKSGFTDCTCKHWDLFIRRMNNEVVFSDLLDCNKLKNEVTLPPNNKTNEHYSIDVYLHSNRKYENSNTL